MNENEMTRIAAAINRLRPDWPTASIHTLLADPALADRPRRDVAVALTWVACEADTKTPARVKEAGPWWRATNPEGDRAPRPPKPHEACVVCGRHFDTCLCEGGPTMHIAAPLPDPAPRVAHLRAIAQETGMALCSHGVPRTNCIDHRSAKTDPPTEGDAS